MQLTGQQGPTLAPTNVPLPTATPFLYVVAENDTMIGIAVRFGLTLDELQLANPGVDPRVLSVGTELVIPTGAGGGAPALPAPTAAALDVAQSYCYPTAATGLWCFMLVENDQPQSQEGEDYRPLENISASIALYSAEGAQLASKEAFAPLNLLQVGARLPLVVFFDSPPAEWAFAQGQVLTALSVSSESGRYLDAEIEEMDIQISNDGLFANISADVGISGSQPASVIWIAAIAYDAEGRVVGVRRWESGGGESPVSAAFQVFSLGPPITAVELLVEARP